MIRLVRGLGVAWGREAVAEATARAWRIAVEVFGGESRVSLTSMMPRCPSLTSRLVELGCLRWGCAAAVDTAIGDCTGVCCL